MVDHTRKFVMPSSRLISQLFAIGTAALLAAAACAEDWPHWRGAHRNGTTTEASGWNGERWIAPEPAWSKNVGVGSTSPIVASGRLYVLGWFNGKDTLLCHDAATGERLWSQSYNCPQFGRKASGDQGLYAGPTSTPEFDPATKLLYTLSTDGDLCCWDTAREGASVWRLNLYDEFDPPQRPKFGRSGLRDYGYTSAPLVHGDWLLVEVGDDTGTVMAFDKRTGKLAWKSQCRDEAGHTGGPVPLTVDGLACVAVLTCKHLVVVRLDAGHEGETLGEYPWATDFANNIATPAVAGQDILITSEYNHGTMCKLRASRTGLTKVWEVPYPSKVCSPVIGGDSIYVAWEKLRCLDLATGKLRWEGGRFGDDGSCLATSDGRTVVWGRGTLALCDGAGHSPAAYRELARKDNLSDTDCWPHVVLAEGRVYCKDRNGRLTCWETAK
jgi:outer membrane protein assembly factor BamB